MLSAPQLTPIEELELKAKEILDPAIYDFIAGGAGSEYGLRNNRSKFQLYSIIPRVLQDVRTISTELKLLNKKLETPILFAPCAFHKLACTQGEIATAKAAQKIGTIMTLSTMSSCSIEEVADISKGTKWFQLYIFKNRAITESLVKRAELNGYEAIIVTVDVPMMGMRLRDIRNRFKLPPNIDSANFRNFHLPSLSDESKSSKIKEHTDQQFDAGLTWDTIDWLASFTKLPIMLKGILNVDDALESLNHKIAGLIVSNHGARQIDDVISPLEVLPDIADVIFKKIPIIVDGGIRSGEDIFKALALGADAVMIGRPILWSLAIGGEKQLISTYQNLQQELISTMRLSGCSSLEKIHEFGLSLLSSQSLTMRNILQKLQHLSPKSDNVLMPKKSMLFSKL